MFISLSKIGEDKESDIPTTIILSKAECPHLDAYNSVSTNRIVIEKLIQIWSHLRSVKKGRKGKQDQVKMSNSSKEATVPKKVVSTSDSIYDDIGDYVPVVGTKHKESRVDKSTWRQSYFGDKSHHSSNDRLDTRTTEQQALQMAISVVGKVAQSSDQDKFTPLMGNRKSKLQEQETESYAECYPGAVENDDAIMDSDDEVDFSKMDSGMKKGQVKRWDFDTPEEYNHYMSNKEALPKAAFQFGVKMAEGRAKGKKSGKKDGNAKLDRDLQRINAIIAKRKQDDQGSSDGKRYKN